MRVPRFTRPLAVGLLTVSLVGLSACGAGSRTGAATATKVACDFTKPAQATTVNVLAYNSSAVDPFSNTMVASCSHDGVTVKHDPIDFAGQLEKTTATLAGDAGTYDIVETYTYAIPDLASRGKLEPLDDLFAKYKDKYTLNELDANTLKSMTYNGKLYGVPMQSQLLTMAYRKDLFDKNGLTPPTTFEELRTDAKKLQDAEGMKYPIALPLLSTADLDTAFAATLGSQDSAFFVNPDTKKPNFTQEPTAKALEQLKSLLPYMDPQVTTFDQPKVQQQLYNGKAAVAVMFSGRMNDLVQQQNTKLFDKFAFAAPPAVFKGGKAYSTVSTDGWSIPFNTKVDKDLLFQLVAASVSKEASQASVPAAFPARTTVDQSASPYAAAAKDSLAKGPTKEIQPYVPAVSDAIRPVLANYMAGKIDVPQAQQQMQAAAEKVLAAQK
jgi:sorbitol/mannitol transport system substrate-binding protein